MYKQSPCTFLRFLDILFGIFDIFECFLAAEVIFYSKFYITSVLHIVQLVSIVKLTTKVNICSICVNLYTVGSLWLVKKQFSDCSFFLTNHKLRTMLWFTQILHMDLPSGLIISETWNLKTKKNISKLTRWNKNNQLQW